MTTAAWPVYRFALQDEDGCHLGVFESHRRLWKLGDQVITRDGRRSWIVAIRDVGAERGSPVVETWLVDAS